MLNILGSSNPFQRGVNRRTAMSIGALGAVSLSLPELLYHQSRAASDSSASSTFGRAKRILLVYLQG
ncbi:MAG: hypothetical protein GY826_38535, partial [Fuerstiella sp.]|nr:hypothetical protein [Fuerstiella sp.]